MAFQNRQSIKFHLIECSLFRGGETEAQKGGVDSSKVTQKTVAMCGPVFEIPDPIPDPLAVPEKNPDREHKHEGTNVAIIAKATAVLVSFIMVVILFK